jgi:hypothetical protein
MNSSLKERFARLGRTRVIDRVRNGSPAVLALRPCRGRKGLNTVALALALAKRGLSMLCAKRAVEEMTERGRVVVLLPNLESGLELANELAQAGCTATSIGNP